MQGRIEGVNGFIKGLRRSAFGYQDFDCFDLLIWEQTHRKKRYRGAVGEIEAIQQEEQDQLKTSEADLFLLDVSRKRMLPDELSHAEKFRTIFSSRWFSFPLRLSGEPS